MAILTMAVEAGQHIAHPHRMRPAGHCRYTQYLCTRLRHVQCMHTRTAYRRMRTCYGRRWSTCALMPYAHLHMPPCIHSAGARICTTAYTPHTPCSCTSSTAHTLHIHCTSTAYTLHTHTLHTHTAYTLHMHCIYTLQVHIVYGTEDTSNAELLSHYGFVDRGALLLSSSSYYST